MKKLAELQKMTYPLVELGVKDITVEVSPNVYEDIEQEIKDFFGDASIVYSREYISGRTDYNDMFAIKWYGINFLIIKSLDL